MYPSQTSLIPVTVALSRFLQERGFSAFWENYPYWYLGTTPFRFLTGPIVPLAWVAVQKILPGVGLFSIAIWSVMLSFFIAAVGWGILGWRISGKRALGFVIGGLTLVLPWKILSSLALDEASLVLARNFLPFALLTLWSFLKATSRKSTLWALLATTFLLLINTTILPILAVGISGLVLARSYRKGKIRNISKYLKTGLTLIVGSLLLLTLWYSPGYWLTVLTNPSIGGASSLKVIFRVFDLLKAAVPLVLAVGVVYFSGRVKKRVVVFALTWTFTFLFLTVFRFIGDPDFWTDWTSWFFELEIGIAILAARPLVEFFTRPKLAYILLFLGLSSSFFFSFFVYRRLGRPELISSQIPAGVASLEKLAETIGHGSTPSFDPELRTEGFTTSRVFLSGSTVFWADALYDIYQVRGGRDQVATHPSWDKAAYELREGHDPEATRRWLKELNISYVLVHGLKSSEYYHDFKNTAKWDEVGERVWEEGGDIIYRVIGK